MVRSWRKKRWVGTGGVGGRVGFLCQNAALRERAGEITVIRRRVRSCVLMYFADAGRIAAMQGWGSGHSSHIVKSYYNTHTILHPVRVFFG